MRRNPDQLACPETGVGGDKNNGPVSLIDLGGEGRERAAALEEHLKAYAEPGPEGLVFPAPRRVPAPGELPQVGLATGGNGGRRRASEGPRSETYLCLAGHCGRG